MSTVRDLRGSGDRSMDNCAVSVGYYGPELYAMTETNKIWRLNQDDLRAEKQVRRRGCDLRDGSVCIYRSGRRKLGCRGKSWT